MARSINTGLTTLFTLIALYVLGGTTIEGFALALIIGIAVGGYPSSFTASPVVVTWYNLADRRKGGAKAPSDAKAPSGARTASKAAVAAVTVTETDTEEEAEARPTMRQTMKEAERAAQEEKRRKRRERRKKDSNGRGSRDRKRRF